MEPVNIWHIEKNARYLFIQSQTCHCFIKRKKNWLTADIFQDICTRGIVIISAIIKYTFKHHFINMSLCSLWKDVNLQGEFEKLKEVTCQNCICSGEHSGSSYNPQELIVWLLQAAEVFGILTQVINILTSWENCATAVLLTRWTLRFPALALDVSHWMWHCLLDQDKQQLWLVCPPR